ncbi:hypothetical protein CB1_001458001 [Camelus ferus]|nr:hypothetical protein CB1_001458001 [Camelus ferus]
MSLYFNAYFFPLWWVSSITMLQVKYSVLPDYYKFIVVTVIILVTLIEVIRLYLGYMGNLQEKVPELAGFWLLSLLLQLPLILFLLFNEGLTNLPLEKAVHIIFTTFLTFQVISAFLTMRKMAGGNNKTVCTSHESSKSTLKPTCCLRDARYLHFVVVVDFFSNRQPPLIEIMDQLGKSGLLFYPSFCSSEEFLGSAADIQAVADAITYQLGFHSIELNEPPLVHTTASLFKEICYRYRKDLMAGIIVAG